MKIKQKVLSGFLGKASMSSEQQINEAMLRFEKDGLKIDANSAPKQARVMAWLKTNAFKEYEELGNVGISDMTEFIKVIGRFGETISVSKEGNLLTIKGEGKSVDVELVAENFLAGDTGEPKLEFEDTFGMTATKLKELFADCSLSKDAILTIETEEKKVIFTNTGKYKFKNVIEAPTCKGGTKVKFGQPLIDAATVLDGNLEFSVKNDYPAKIMEKTETSVITLIVAPRVED